jgi:hypothetical protein
MASLEGRSGSYHLKVERTKRPKHLPLLPFCCLLADVLLRNSASGRPPFRITCSCLAVSLLHVFLVRLPSLSLNLLLLFQWLQLLPVQSQPLATGCTVRGSNPGGGEIFSTRPDRPWGLLSLLYNGYRVIPRG